MRILVVAMLACAACTPPKTIRSEIRRGPIWAQPGTPLVFAWSFRERERTQSGLETDHSDPEKSVHWVHSQFTDIDHIRATVFDPATGNATRLAETDTQVQPIYWDGRTLWVHDSFGIVTGLTAGREDHPGHGGWVSGGLPRPFVGQFPAGDLLDLSTGKTIELDRESGDGAVTLDRFRIMRLTRVKESGGQLMFQQTVIDWAQPQPVRLPNVLYTTPPLPEGSKRAGKALTTDGRRFVEVVTTDAGTNVIVHDFEAGRIIAALPIAPLDESPVLYALAGDKLAFLHHEADCMRGSTIAIDTQSVVPTTVCIRSVEGPMLQTEKGTGYVANDGKLLRLGTTATKPLDLGVDTRAYTVETDDGGVDVESFDFATATRTTLGHHASRSDTLLNVVGKDVYFVGASDHIVIEPGGRTSSLP